MKPISKFANALRRRLPMFVFCACLAFGSRALAEGTKEIISDAGLYSGSPSGSFNVDLYTWSFYGPNGIIVDANREGIPGTPEGRKLVSFLVTNRWGGGGVFFLHDVDPIVVDRDCSAFTNGHLRFWLKSTNQLSVEIEFVSITGTIQKSLFAAPSTTNNWMEFVVPFNRFTPPPNLSRIRGPFLITSPDTLGRKQYFVDHVRWTKPVVTLEIYPAGAQLHSGKQMQYSIEGRTTEGEKVLLYANFSTTGSCGSLDPATPYFAMSSVLHASGNPGAVVATAIASTQPVSVLSVTSIVETAMERIDQQLGILTETAFPIITLDTDSKLLVFTNDITLSPELAPTIDNKMEGNESLRTTVTHTIADNYSGWTIQWGQTWTTDDDTRDMSQFYDEFIRFWFLGQPQLQGKIIVGVRSGNTPAGRELCRYDWLTNYAACDGQWHAVSIPVRELAGSRPWADLSRIKNFFTIAVTGDTGGRATFFVDNLRWGTLRPRFTSIAFNPVLGAQLHIESNPGVLHVLERSSNLSHWTPVSTNVPSLPVFQWLDSGAVSGESFFYRARIE